MMLMILSPPQYPNIAENREIDGKPPEPEALPECIPNKDIIFTINQINSCQSQLFCKTRKEIKLYLISYVNICISI